MDGNIIIRRFKEEDLTSLSQLIINTISVSYREVFSPEAIEFFQDYHDQKNILSDAAAGYTIIAELDGEIVGTGTLFGTNIRRVFISPYHQHRGIGKLIAQELEKKALQKNITPLDLSASLVSRPFWEKMGFTVCGEYFLPIDNGRKLHFYEMVKEYGMQPER